MPYHAKEEYLHLHQKIVAERLARQQEQEMQRIAMHKMQVHRAFEPLDVRPVVLTKTWK